MATHLILVKEPREGRTLGIVLSAWVGTIEKLVQRVSCDRSSRVRRYSIDLLLLCVHEAKHSRNVVFASLFSPPAISRMMFALVIYLVTLHQVLSVCDLVGKVCIIQNYLFCKGWKHIFILVIRRVRVAKNHMRSRTPAWESAHQHLLSFVILFINGVFCFWESNACLSLPPSYAHVSTQRCTHSQVSDSGDNGYGIIR